MGTGHGNNGQKLDCELLLIANLAAQDFMNQVTSLLDFRKCKKAVHVLTIAIGVNDTGTAQNCNMLRHVGAGERELFLKFRHAPLALAEQREQLQTLGMSERFADECLSLEDSLVNRRNVSSIRFFTNRHGVLTAKVRVYFAQPEFMCDPAHFLPVLPGVQPV